MEHVRPLVTVISARVRLLDENGDLLRLITPGEAATMLEGHRVEAKGTKTRIRSLRYITADRGVFLGPTPLRKAGLGDPHRRETDTNPSGCWTLDRLPNEPRTFLHVIESAISK